MASKNPQVREIEKEASRRAAADGKTSHRERFDIRAQLRDEAGLSKEQRVRGGVARVWDNEKRWLAPAVSAVAGLIPGVNAAVPAILGGLKGFDREGQSGIGYDIGEGAKGALTGFGAGKVGGAIGDLAGIGGGAAGAVPAPVAGGADLANVANASVTGAGGAVPAAGGFGGFLDRAKGLLTPDNILTGLQGLNAARGMARETDLTNEAVGLDRNRWRENAPLRDAGMEGLLNPQVADTSGLRQLSGQGNPFALPAPSPNATLPAGVGAVPAPQGPVAPAPLSPNVPRRLVPAPARGPRFGGLR